ncbi:MAG: hypothetical protein FWF77_04115, partial [Defluviitaleaceae bacterium]|nr:hypothetical protein [Defluviitaleaceae bacterium]
MLEGIITKGVGGAYTVMTNGVQPLFYTCKARGVFRNKKVRQAHGGHRGDVSEAARSLEAGGSFAAHK